MGKVYKNLHEIPIPSEGHINHNDGRVSIFLDGNKNRPRVIGHATSETTMQPNDNFRFYYPALWKEYYPNQSGPSEHALNAGFYALSLGIGYKTNLYPILQDVYGPQYANAIMDYCDYSILDKSDVSLLYPDRMSHEVLFSECTRSDSWLSDFFEEKINEDYNHQFKIEWLKNCKERGVKKVWLGIDGSNNDCVAEKSDLPQKGHAKSGKNINIVSYIYAVDVETGIPITYFVNHGNVTDSKAFQKIITFLNASEIEVEGVILDRGFDTHDVISVINELKLKYVIMLKAETNAHKEMFEKHALDVRWDVRHCVNEKGIFAVQDTVRLFASHPEESKVTLFFDGVNGSERSVALIQKVLREAKDIESRLAAGEEKVKVSQSLRKYISIEEDSSGIKKVQYRYNNWQKALDEKGFSSIASSDELSGSEVDRIYNLRDASEVQFSILKTQLGYDVTRVHYTNGIENKMAICFIASIIRSEIMNACKKLCLDTNKMIQEIDRIKLILLPDGKYIAINDLSKRQCDLLAEYDLEPNSFTHIARMVNQRNETKIYSPIHTMPAPPAKKPKGRPKKEKDPESENKPKRKPGRPKGSKNKKTLEKEASNTEANDVVKRGRGRPKGSKNKPKKPKVKRGRGRPRKEK